LFLVFFVLFSSGFPWRIVGLSTYMFCSKLGQTKKN
jgi:hypothetical protein